MLTLLDTIEAWRAKVGRYPRICELMDATDRQGASLRRSLRAVQKLGLVETIAHFVDDAKAAPIATVYALSANGRRAIGLS
jgi:DNA-binding PadR family transcriptional regulator